MKEYSTIHLQQILCMKERFSAVRLIKLGMLKAHKNENGVWRVKKKDFREFMRNNAQMRRITGTFGGKHRYVNTENPGV